MNVPIIEKNPPSKAGVGGEAETGPEGGAVSSTPLSPREPGLHVLTTTSRGFVFMISAILRYARNHKGFALWNFVRYAICVTYFWVGGSFFFGGRNIHIPDTYHLIENIEPGGVRLHGAILVTLAVWVATKPAFKNQTTIGLLVMLFYSLMSAFLVIGGWAIHQPALTAPALYALVAALSFALIFSAPLAARNLDTKNGGQRA